MTDSQCMLFLDVSGQVRFFSQIPTSGVLDFSLPLCIKELANSVFCNGDTHHHPNNTELILSLYSVNQTVDLALLVLFKTLLKLSFKCGSFSIIAKH